MKLTPFVICASLVGAIHLAHTAPPAMARAGLTPEEHFLYAQEQRGLNWRDLSLTQRCERLVQMRRERQAMTPAAMQKLKQRLAAEWSAMPAAEQQRIEQRIAAHRARIAQNSGAPNRPRCPGA